MKKLLSFALIAIVALATTAFVSCSSSEDEDDTFIFSGKIYALDVSNAMSSTIVNYYQQIVGNGATVSATSSYLFTISGNIKDQETVVAKLKSANMSGLRTELDKLFETTTLDIIVNFDGDQRWTYYMSPAVLIPGTYTATVGDVNYKFVIGEPTSNTELPASCTINDTTYDGVVTFDTDKETICFTDNATKGTTLTIDTTFDIYACYSVNCSNFTANVTLNGVSGFPVQFERQ